MPAGFEATRPCPTCNGSGSVPFDLRTPQEHTAATADTITISLDARYARRWLHGEEDHDQLQEAIEQALRLSEHASHIEERVGSK